MKYLTTILIFIIANLCFGQTKSNKEKFIELEADIRLGIWDKENSNKSIKIEVLSYDDIPRALDFRGTVIEALKWSDSMGENILIQTVTGHFTWKDYEDDSTDYMTQDKSELYIYLFQKSNGDDSYKRKWRVYDYIECFGVDRFTGFVPQATTITDLDNNGITEIALPYVLICRGGMDPGVMKIIMYEGTTKYALRGSTRIGCKTEHPYGGEYEPSDNLKKNKLFMDFLSKHWNRNKCEEGKYY